MELSSYQSLAAPDDWGLARQELRTSTLRLMSSPGPNVSVGNDTGIVSRFAFSMLLPPARSAEQLSGADLDAVPFHHGLQVEHGCRCP